MAWVSKRRSVPCVLRHHGAAANDPGFEESNVSTQFELVARRCIAALFSLCILSAFAIARAHAVASNAPQEKSLQRTCLIEVLRGRHIADADIRKLCLR
jgi:hypothetical protein